MKITTENGGLYKPNTSSAIAAQRVEGRSHAPGMGRAMDASLDRVEVSEIGGMLARLLDASDGLRANEVAHLSRLYAADGLEVNTLELSRAMLQDAIENGKLGEA